MNIYNHYAKITITASKMMETCQYVNNGYLTGR